MVIKQLGGVGDLVRLKGTVNQFGDKGLGRIG